MLITQYKFNKSYYANYIPTFNSGFTYEVVDDNIEGNIVTSEK